VPDSEDEAAGLLDTCLTAQRKHYEGAARSAGGEQTGAFSGAQNQETA
jgi:hypothetical protein